MAFCVQVTFVFAIEFPYGSRVSTKTATVHSGPGAKYYATDQLPYETRVEVYRHDDEWAAIRPPVGSFSWVPASAIELTEDTSRGHVAYSGVRTRIGSRLNDQRSAEYVELKADEEVIILDRRTIVQDGKQERWYQIQPPAGEFRWVQLSSLEPLPNLLEKTNEDESDSHNKFTSEVDLAQFVEDAPSLLKDDAANFTSPDFETPEFDHSASESKTPASESKTLEPQSLIVQPRDLSSPPPGTLQVDGTPTPASEDKAESKTTPNANGNVFR